MLGGNDYDPDALKFHKLPPSSVFGPSQRHRFNLGETCFNLFLPWFLYLFVFTITSFRLHYDAASTAWTLVLVSLLIPVIAIILGWQARQRDASPLWYLFAAVSCSLAIGSASFFGNMNFVYNMKPFYKIETLNMYPAVNPAVSKGSQLMDAGRIYFAKGAGIDHKRAMGFKSSQLFCVAPIVIGDGKAGSYDFWAVGTDCCSGVSSDFRCGEYNNPSARAGLRLIDDDTRPYYRLAVQQAEAAYNIKSTHPLFFKWMQDPIEEVSSYEEAGYKYCLIGLFAFFLVNLCLVIAAVIAFSSQVVGEDPRDNPNNWAAYGSAEQEKRRLIY